MSGPGRHHQEWFDEFTNICAGEAALKEDEVDDVIVESDTDRAAYFLKDVGFSALKQGAADEDAEFYNCLTKKQKQTINRKLDTVHQRVKSQHTDVRNIFPGQDLQKSGQYRVDGPVLSTLREPQENPPSSVNSLLRPSDPKGLDESWKIRSPPPRYSQSEDSIYIPPPDYNTRDSVGEDVFRPQTFEGKEGAGGRASPCPPGYGGNDDGPGVTLVSDLGKKDLKKLSFIARVELEMVFDEHNLTPVRYKSKKKIKENGIYGVSLQTLLERDRKNSPDCSVPLFLVKLIEHLERCGLAEEGILRLSGGVARIRDCRQEIDAKWQRGKFSLDEIQVHDATGLLKQFLRELPDSLLTLERMDAFLKILDVPDETKQQELLNLLIIMLPEINRDTLKLLLGFLRKVIDQPENKMTLMSVAMIIAPNLFVIRTKGNAQRRQENMELELQMAERTSKVVMMMIERQDNLWIVPSRLVKQIRDQNETRKTKINIPGLGRKDRSEAYKTIISADRGSGAQILVSLENASGETTISITDATTSSEVINQMLLSRSPKPTKKATKSTSKYDVKEHMENPAFSATSDNSVLVEVGGNIGERRLDGSVRVMSVVLGNPNAKFVVRQKLS